MSKPIEGKVAQILNEREVAINVGAEHGVESGMKFEILSEKLIVITDPDTGDEIGTREQVKVRVKVVELQPPKWVTRVKTLRIDQSELPGPLDEKDSIVRRGDRVRQIVETD